MVVLGQIGTGPLNRYTRNSRFNSTQSPPTRTHGKGGVTLQVLRRPIHAIGRESAGRMMEARCLVCSRGQWVGLLFCTKCGARMETFADVPPGPAEMALLYSGPLPPEVEFNEQTRLFPVFGKLVITNPHFPSVLLTLHDESPSANPLPAAYQGADIVTVGRWLVALSEEGLNVITAPLLGLVGADHTTLLLDSESSAPPVEVKKALGRFGKEGVSSIARLGQYLVHIGSAGPNQSMLRVWKPPVSQTTADPTWELCEEKVLAGSRWVLDRAAWNRSDRLVLHSDKEARVWSIQGNSPPQEEVYTGLPEDCRLCVGTPVLTSDALLFLVDTQEEKNIPFRWAASNRDQARKVQVPHGLKLNGIEPSLKDGLERCVARIGTTFHLFNSGQLSFLAAPLTAPEVNQVVASVPGAIVYKSNNGNSLRTRWVDEDTLLPVDASSTIRAAETEGPRLWMVARHAEDADQTVVHVLERRTS